MERSILTMHVLQIFGYPFGYFQLFPPQLLPHVLFRISVRWMLEVCGVLLSTQQAKLFYLRSNLEEGARPEDVSGQAGRMILYISYTSFKQIS